MGPAKPSDLLFFFFCERFVSFAKLLTIFTNNLVVLGDWATKF